jgi:hypothetical protein
VTPARHVAHLTPAALRPKDAAAYLSVGETFLRHLPIAPVRVPGTGKRGKEIVLYLVTDLNTWLAEQAARRAS